VDAAQFDDIPPMAVWGVDHVLPPFAEEMNPTLNAVLLAG
jgi:hypothetical protein